MPALFNGQYLVTPTVASAVDDSQMYPDANPSGNILALIGESNGGVPKKAVRLRSPMHARSLLRSGPLCEAAIRAFSPSAATGSPAAILAVRVDPASQSTLDLSDAAGTPILRLRSTDYGAHTASMEARLEAGSRTGYRVSIRQDGRVYTRDNVGADVLSLAYRGAGASAAVRVAAGQLVLEAPAGTPVRSYTLSDWSTAASLAEAITGALPDWDVALTRGLERFKPANLDAVTVADAKTSALLSGHAWSLVNYINSSAEILVDAEFLAPTPVAAPDLLAWTALAGGANGNVVGIDWEEALGALYEIDVQWLVPLSDEPAVWDMAAAHCEYLSSTKRERRAFVGAGNGVTAEQAQVHALSINSDRVGYVWPGFYDYDTVTRALQLQPAYQAAVLTASGFASSSPGVTMSRKSLSVAGAEVLLHEPADTDALIQAGVCALVQTDGGVIVSQAVSTWRQDDRYDRREISVGAAVDYVVRTVRAALAPLLGDRASPQILPSARSRLDSVLSDLSVAPPIGPGVLVGDGTNPAYRNLSVSLKGDTLSVAFECQPVIPINYVLVGISVAPYSGSTN